MKKSFLRHIVLASLLLVGLDLARTIWFSQGDVPSETYHALLTPPPRTIQDPKENAYLFLLGFSAGASADPMRVGYDMWLEADSDRGHRPFDYSKESRLELQMPDDALDALQANGSVNELGPLRAPADSSKPLPAPHAILLDRYRQWLALPFDDWGSGHPGTPRLADVYAAHRLYLAEGWSQNAAIGMDRLTKDFQAWRAVLANAKTLPLKLFAVAMVEEDARILSDGLNLPDFDPRLLPHVDTLARPLTSVERSLRWPIQHEFVIGMALLERPLTGTTLQLQSASEAHKRWISTMTGIRPDAFQMIEHPIPATILARASMQKQRMLNIYAAYCDATIKAADQPNSPFPKLQDMARLTHHRVLDYFINPIDNVFASGPEPDWTPFADRLLRTDARLRLVALQAKLHRPGQDRQLPSRVAQAGSAFYDPFSGLPMLWSPTMGRLYSVGEDRRDDGGEGQRDIAVSLAAPLTAAGTTVPISARAQ